MLLPPGVEAHLDDRVDVVRSTLPDLRWVPGSRWHVTLEFLGACGRHEADRQAARWADRAAAGSAFEASVAGSGAFPDAWRARVLFAGVVDRSGGLARLSIEGQVSHVTLARTRQPRDLTGVVESLSEYCGPSWRVEQVALMESHLRGAGERGPRYEPLEYFTLGGGQPSAGSST
jgi:RNA 2',3'-cyclic 3'-phosphodiesterase